MYNKLKKICIENYMYIFEFLFFLYILYMVPPICDRWFENAAYSFEHPLRVFLAQFRWLVGVNARVLNNFFSSLVDRNQISHALINAIMITASSILMVQISNLVNEKNMKLKKIISVILMLFVSFGIRQEVYFYATTLYISSFLIVLVLIFIINKFKWVDCSFKQKAGILLYIFLSCTWLENISFSISGLFALFLFYSTIKQKKVNKEYLSYFLSAFFGFIVMLCSSYFGTYGRLTTSNKFNFQSWVNDVFQVTCDNYVILMIIAVFILIILIKNIKLNSNIFAKGFNVAQVIYWVIICLFCVLQGVRFIYEIISSHPIEREFAEKSYLWRTFSNSYLEQFFVNINNIYSFFLLPGIIIGIISVFYVILKLQKGTKIYSMLLIISSLGMLLNLLTMQFGARISSLVIFLLITFSVVLAGENEWNMPIRQCALIFEIACILITGIQADAYSMFAREQKKVGDQRLEIVNYVYEQQLLGVWDYDTEVIMPEFEKNGQGLELYGSYRKNPDKNDPYYDILLRYYNLDRETKVIFGEIHE